MSNDANLKDLKEIIERLNRTAEPVLDSYFRDIANRNYTTDSVETLPFLIRDLENIAKAAWTLVDIPIAKNEKRFDELHRTCGEVSVKYGIAISPQTSKNCRYFRGILLDKNSFLKTNNGNTNWVVPPEGMFFKVIFVLDYVLISMKSCKSFTYKFNDKKNKKNMRTLYERKFYTNN